MYGRPLRSDRGLEQVPTVSHAGAASCAVSVQAGRVDALRHQQMLFPQMLVPPSLLGYFPPRGAGSDPRYAKRGR